jgi:hypothetical protein
MLIIKKYEGHTTDIHLCSLNKLLFIVILVIYLRYSVPLSFFERSSLLLVLFKDKSNCYSKKFIVQKSQSVKANKGSIVVFYYLIS